MDDARLRNELRRYWDEIARGEPATPGELDPELAAAVRHVHALRDVPSPDPAFANRLEESLMHATTIPLPPADPRATPHRNGRNARPANPGTWLSVLISPQRGMPAYLATALFVLIVLIGSVLAFGPGRPRRQDDAAAFLPALSGAPATPEAAAMAPQVAELVWSLDGGPELPFDDPYKVAIDPSGNLWVPGGSSGQFLIFDSDGNFLETWGTPGSGDGQFDFDYDGYGYGGIVWDANGNFYVADAGNRRIQKFAPDRTFLTSWGSEGRENGQFLGMGNLAIDQQGRLFAADHARDDIQVFDLNGNFLDVWGGYGLEAGQLANPGGIAIDADGNLYICEYSGHRIQKFAPDGTSLAVWGGYGGDEGEFANPNDVAVDKQGRVYVADWGNSRVQVFDAAGRFLTAWDDAGFLEGQLLGTTGVTPDGAGFLYVANEGNDTVQKFRLLPPLAS